MVRGMMEGGAGWPRERTTSLYYKMLVGSREGQRMCRERTIHGAGGFQHLPGAALAYAN